MRPKFAGRVLLAFELAERQMLETGRHPALNFVIVGGGPTGVELAGAISDIARLYMRKDFRHITPSSAQVLIVEGSQKILGSYPDDLQAAARRQLAALGVQIRTGVHVTDIQPGYVMAGDERIDSLCTLWAAGVQASPLGRMLGVETDKKGAVLVDEHLNAKGHPEIYVIGDLAHFEQDGKQVPGVAQPAMQMGDYAARRIGRLVGSERGSDGPLKDKGFRYFDKGDMATIGRKAAVANIQWPFKGHLSGFPAWVSWLVVHIFFLIGFRNRFSVFRQWAWTYLTFNDGARLITGSQELPGWEMQDGVYGMRVRSDHTAPRYGLSQEQLASSRRATTGVAYRCQCDVSAGTWGKGEHGDDTIRLQQLRSARNDRGQQAHAAGRRGQRQHGRGGAGDRGLFVRFLPHGQWPPACMRPDPLLQDSPLRRPARRSQASGGARGSACS